MRKIERAVTVGHRKAVCDVLARTDRQSDQFLFEKLRYFETKKLESNVTFQKKDLYNSSAYPDYPHLSE